MTNEFPTAARIIIIGGGVIGTSIAYHLTLAGEKDVLLLEKSKLTEGATWHAAGLVGQFRSQKNLMQLMKYSVQLYQKLGSETGQDTGWQSVGSLRLAKTEDRWKEILKSYSSAQAVGLEMNLLSAQEAGEIFPLIETADLTGAAYIPQDGYIDPYSLTQAYAKGIRTNGGRIIEGVMVKDLQREQDRITHVITDRGRIEAEVVVNAAGLWARQVGWMAGVEIPAGVVEHQYLVTEKSALIPDHLPALRDPDGGYYVKPEPGALAIGGWEINTRKVDPLQGFGWKNEHHLFDPNMDRLQEFFAPAISRIPVLADLGMQSIINGPIPISPDGEPVMGPVPGLDNFFTACAFTSGIAASGGAGKAMADWILHGDPGLDLWPFDIRRFGPLQAGHRFLHDRAVESYGRYYAIHYPGEEAQSARGVRRSPLYQTLKEQGAVFGSKFGWERANWFAYGDIPQRDTVDFDRSQQLQTVGREHQAAREGVVLIDMSSFSKFEISGQQVSPFLQYLAVADVDVEPGQACYTQLCNHQGGIEADVTLIRRSEHVYWLITGSGLGVRDRQWIESHLRGHGNWRNHSGQSDEGGWIRSGEQWIQPETSSSHPISPAFSQVEIHDITSAWGVINLAGPMARKVLGKVCDDDISHQGFPFMTARDIRIGYAPALAFRVSYIGELGWELYIPCEYLQYVYELLQQAGAEFAITPIGYHAIDSLRLEKRHLAWGIDITPDYNPIEAGLLFLIKWDKGDFSGAQALEAIRSTGVQRKLVTLTLEDPLPVFGGEAIFHDGRVISQTTSGNFGYSIGKSIVLAYLPIELLSKNEFEVESFGKRSIARIIKGAAYDPAREKILC